MSLAPPELGFSAREAHEWLLAGAPEDALRWLADRLAPEYSQRLRSVRVVRWLAAVRARGQWAALTRVRDFPGPRGAIVRAAYADRIDEIDDGDIHALSDGVHAVFERAAQRFTEAQQEQWARDHAPLMSTSSVWHSAQSSRVRVLDTASALAREGREMGHCVGGYADWVRRGVCVIVAIRIGKHRSTVELDQRGSVRQHHGPRNRAPHLACVRVLDSYLRRVRRRGGLTRAA